MSRKVIDTAIDALCASKSKKAGPNDEIIVNGNRIGWRYHNTFIVIVDKDTKMVTVNSGGWRTSSTKERIDDALGRLCGLGVRQVSGQWYTMKDHTAYPYEDGDRHPLTITL